MLDRLQNLLERSTSAIAAPLRDFGDQPPARLAVERGIAWPLLEESPSFAGALAATEVLFVDAMDVADVDVVDRAGHARPAYRGLLWYAAFQAIRASDRVVVGATADIIVRQIATLKDDVEAAIRQQGERAWPASQGSRAAQVAWDIVAVWTAGELLHDGVTRWAQAAMKVLIERQQPTGAYLLGEAGDNPETFWFHELQIAHAIATLGLQSRDATMRASAARAAMWHMNETQPDHATSQPWGLTAFLLDSATHVMVDGLLHSAMAQEAAMERSTGGLSGVSLILIADALYSWRRR